LLKYSLFSFTFGMIFIVYYFVYYFNINSSNIRWDAIAVVFKFLMFIALSINYPLFSPESACHRKAAILYIFYCACAGVGNEMVP
jgi:hypothetical protein